MKPDGVTMDTTDATEPNETAGAAEPSVSQDNITEQTSLQTETASNDAASKVAKKANGKSEAAEPKVKQAVAPKMQAPTKSLAYESKSKSGAASHRLVNDVHSNNKMTTAKKTAALPSAKPALAGAVPKKTVAMAAVSPTVKKQSRVPDRRPVGPVRTSVTAATATNGAKQPTVNGIASHCGVPWSRTAGASNRSVASVAPKSSTSTTANVEAGRVPKATRATTAPARPQTSSSTSRTVTTRPSTAPTARSATSRLTTAPSSARTTAVQTSRTTTSTTTAAAKKDVGRLPSAAVAKRPTTAFVPAATKKTDPIKPTAAGKPNSASRFPAKAVDPKVSQTKTQQPLKPSLTKKLGVAAALPNAANKQPFGRTPPASPANKPASSSTALAKRGTKPTQTVPPFTAVKKTKASNSVTSRRAPGAVEVEAAAPGAVEVEVAAAAVVVSATVVAAATVQTEMHQEAGETLPQESIVAASAPEVAQPLASAQDTSPELMPQEPAQSHLAASSLPQTPMRTASPETSPQEQGETTEASQKMTEKVSAPAEPILPRVASPQEVSQEPENLLTDQTPSTSKVPQVSENPITQVVPSTNLNEEEEDEEEKEGSQQVSVSEMSGTTQPTEESRPGSAGLVGGSAWRAGGALFSELDSEDVSGSQQGASELSAPGVLEGTESTDDLGDGSLKGAIDIEGASAGSPDFEKLPDIPVNDFEEDDDDEDDNDRVCDMDVGSERADEPPRPRHDNDLDDEEDDDVEMASEGVTESGLESYGNADEDDFAEDERVDNLNRVAQPPPPPQLPSAPAAQWDQPNPFADPWAEPRPQQLLDEVPQPLEQAGAAAASPLVDPWQADSETPTQSSAQAWLELSSGPFGAENQDCSVKDGPQMYIDQCLPAPMQTLAPAPSSAPGMSLASTLSSDSSTPEELGDNNREGKPQPQDAQNMASSPQVSLDNRDLAAQVARGERVAAEDEAETLPADEISGAPATAPNSNPSSSSVTEDEASDTEGEAQLDDSLESPTISSITFDSQPPGQRCLTTVEEGEEAEVEVGAADDTTPPSATSLASYGFDSTATASNSNAQSTGEGFVKSPGIFSLEELSEEAKDAGLIPQQPAHTCLAEQQYIECGKQDAESAEHVEEEAPASREVPDPSATPGALQQSEENPDDIQPPYYSAICEKTENSFAGNV